MSVVVSFVDVFPPARYDGVAWAQVRIEEATTSTGTWATIDTLDIAPQDTDPSEPELRSFTTPNGTAPNLWYRLIYLDATSGESQPSTPTQNGATDAAYTTTDELFRVLKIRTPTSEQTAAAQRVIDTAAEEINSEIDLAPGNGLTDKQLELCASVNLDRAADLWRHTESVPGVLGVYDEALTLPPMRYSWERYAQRLAVIKDRWGVA